MDVTDKKVIVIGTGISGIGAARLLISKGASVVLYDEREDIAPARIYEDLSACKDRFTLVTGKINDMILDDTVLAVFSPGVPMDSEIAKTVKALGIRIWGEIELAYQYAKGSVLAITGTNGKTTTTSLLGKIMSDFTSQVFVVGNIGNPYTQEVDKMTQDSVTVAEISSFQLETIEEFRPSISAVLNITPDHLNRHHTMEEYARVKFEIAKKQTKEDFCVLNYEDAYCREFAEQCHACVLFFSSKNKLQNGFFLEEEMIYKSVEGECTPLLNIHDMNLLGIHNVENVMAAIAMADAYGVPMERILETVRHFKAVEHRIEYVATKRGVDYYNDSKGTNPDAAIRGIKAMRRPTVLIGGGYDKQSEYDEWIEAFDGKVKCLVLIGQTREKIAECAIKHGFKNVILADTFQEAMDICVDQAIEGDAVLLSPACASWGMFPNYEVRGEMFKEYVNQIKE